MMGTDTLTYNCKICNTQLSQNNSNIGSHVKRKHNILLKNYFDLYENSDYCKFKPIIPNSLKNYKLTNPEFIHEKCGFCDRIAKPKILVDYKNKTIKYSYETGYSCNTIECKNDISISMLGHPYNTKTYEHIGSKVEYIALLKKKETREVKFSKSKGFRENTFRSNLSGFVEKYGISEGTFKYNERNEKIGKANTLIWYINRFGKKEGTIKFNAHKEKLKNFISKRVSKAQLQIQSLFDTHKIKYIPEHPFIRLDGKTNYMDWFLPELNTVIEFNGIFWHCKPGLYEKSYYNKAIGLTAEEIWIKDKKRMIDIRSTYKDVNIVILWEDSSISYIDLINIIQNLGNQNNLTIEL